MGHIYTLRFDYPQADQMALEAMLRSEPFFASSENIDFYYRGQGNLSDGSLEPDCEVSITPVGFRVNVFGECDICDQVTLYLQEHICRTYGNHVHLI